MDSQQYSHNSLVSRSAVSPVCIQFGYIEKPVTVNNYVTTQHTLLPVVTIPISTCFAHLLVIAHGKQYLLYNVERVVRVRLLLSPGYFYEQFASLVMEINGTP